MVQGEWVIPQALKQGAQTQRTSELEGRLPGQQPYVDHGDGQGAQLR